MDVWQARREALAEVARQHYSIESMDRLAPLREPQGYPGSWEDGASAWLIELALFDLCFRRN